MRHFHCLIYMLLVAATACSATSESSKATSRKSSAWPQFRGPNGSGLAPWLAPAPTNPDPVSGYSWKTPLPPGHSSPVIVGDRIYVTGVRDDQLLTIALDRRTGSILWERESPVRDKEAIHSIGSLAQCTVAADADLVVSFFGSSGLICHSKDGERLWYSAMGPFKNDFGAGSSPILIGDRLIVAQDHDTDSFIMCVDRRSGTELWKTDRSEFPRGYASPILWNNDGELQIVMLGTLRAVGYRLSDGKEAWTVRGLSRLVNTSPVVDEAGFLYWATWTSGADSGERFVVKPFDEYAAAHDANDDGLIVRDEMSSDGPLRPRFNQIDRDKTGTVTQAEYEAMRSVFDSAKNGISSVRPGGEGDITETHVRWTHRKHAPYVASPIVTQGLLFCVKDGGIVSCLDTTSGTPHRVGRLTGRGRYYASPIAAGQHLYFASERGQLSVINVDKAWRELHCIDFKDAIYATPAAIDGQLYVRTKSHLFRFDAKPKIVKTF